MVRPKTFKKAMVVSIRFEEEDYRLVEEIASIETERLGIIVTTHELIREAVRFVYGHNERLRECFRRTRKLAAGR